MRWFAALLLTVPLPAQITLPPEAQRLLDRASAADAQNYQFALDQGARILPTTDGRSFYVLWTPSTSDHPPLIVSLHGDAGWAFDEIALWFDQAQRSGYGILALQWWIGPDDSAGSYYAPADAQHELSLALHQAGQAEGTALLHGFSRGSAALYGIEALDRKSSDRFYGFVVADAGGAAADAAPNLSITNGDFGYNAFSGTYWATFCGGLDPNPDRDGCPAMRRSAQWVALYGGVVDVVIEDDKAGHNGFERTPAYLQLALDAFRRNLALRQSAVAPGTVWNVQRDESFSLPGASIPNAGYVQGEVWLMVGGQGGPQLYRSPDGSNCTIPEPAGGVVDSLANSGYTATEVIPRESRVGSPMLFVLGLAPKGINQAVVFRLVPGDNGGWVRSPSGPVYSGSPDEQQFVGVPDVTPTPDGRLRLTYVALGAKTANSRTAIGDVDGLAFTREFDNPFGDLAIPNPKGTDLNVDPAVLQLASGGYLAVTMRGGRLYLFTSLDGRTYVPAPQPPIPPEALAPGTAALFDPTLVQTPDGHVWLYATAGTDPGGAAGTVVRAEITINDPNTPQ